MSDLRNARVTVLGLGLHGGGVETVKFLAAAGARVTVTDTKPAEKLRESIAAIRGLAEHEHYGGHEPADIRNADMVIKNPAVPRDAPILEYARRVETDISLFLRYVRGSLIAVTGSKGKSSVTALVHRGLMTRHPDAVLGGNITISPLSSVQSLKPTTPVVLELSSFQLGDLSLCHTIRTGDVRLKPDVSVITSIFPDHQDYYRGDMDSYVRDKEVIFRSQDERDTLVHDCDEPWATRFESACRATVVRTQSSHRGPDRNRDIAITALSVLGYDGPDVSSALDTFNGLEHRLEYVATRGGAHFYNDSAATVPQATAASVARFRDTATVLIAGGTDKRIDLSGFADSVARAKEIVLLSGSATRRMLQELRTSSIGYHGPYDSLAEAVSVAVKLAAPGDNVIFSPGAASFELFENEFDRGRQFKSLVANLPQ
ncbi:MAG: Mur ligase family protein [Spirochaetales bacterium]